MIVTINTDASWCKYSKHSGYAFYIVSNFSRLKKSGMLRGKIGSPDVAEMKTIINALHTVLHLEYAKLITYIIINTDSLNAKAVFEDDKKHIRMYGLQIHNHFHFCFWQILRKLNGCKKIDIRHVKAHTGTDDKRSHVNDWCDKTAKEELRVYKVTKGLYPYNK